MRNTTTFVIGVILLVVGCAPEQEIDPVLMVGRPLDEVIETYGLDENDSWPWINLPPDGPFVTTYYLKSGNLELWYKGDPPIVKKALYLPSDKSAAERLNAADAEYREWLERRSSKKSQD